MEATAQREVDLHNRVGNELKTMGHATETVPVHEQPVLSDSLKSSLGAIVPEGVEEFVLGKEIDTHVRVTPAGRWKKLVDRLRYVKERFRRK